jgi:hypothetical protein
VLYDSNPARHPSLGSPQENPGAGKQLCRIFSTQQQNLPVQQQACQHVTKNDYRINIGEHKLQYSCNRLKARVPWLTDGTWLCSYTQTPMPHPFHLHQLTHTPSQLMIILETFQAIILHLGLNLPPERRTLFGRADLPCVAMAYVD